MQPDCPAPEKYICEVCLEERSGNCQDSTFEKNLLKKTFAFIKARTHASWNSSKFVCTLFLWATWPLQRSKQNFLIHLCYLLGIRNFKSLNLPLLLSSQNDKSKIDLFISLLKAMNSQFGRISITKILEFIFPATSFVQFGLTDPRIAEWGRQLRHPDWSTGDVQLAQVLE